MPKRLDENQAIAIMRAADFEPLEPYKLIKTPWKCRCLRCGNITTPILNNVKSGHGRGCVTCGGAERGRLASMSKRTNQIELDKILSAKNVALLDEYKNGKSIYRFQCLECKEIFKTKFHYLKVVKSRACPFCRKKYAIRKVINRQPPKRLRIHFNEILRSLNLVSEADSGFSDETINVKCLICDENLEGTFGDFRSKKLKCKCLSDSRSRNRQAKILLEARLYAQSRGGKVLAESISKKSEYVDWECSKGHIWSQPTGGVIRNASWCPICGGNAPRTLEDLRKVVESRGGKLISTEYKNVDASYDFECSRGHKFSNRFSKVVNGGQWCPRCNKGSKSEEICRITFEQIFGFDFPKARPKWLRNSRNNQMEIDGYCEELGIGFEYQGTQHFSKQFYGTSLEKRIADDEIKAKLCQEHGIHLFIIDYKMDYYEFPNQMFQQALRFGIDVSRFNFAQDIDINKAYIRDDRLPILIEILKKKQITVLSTKWIGVRDKYEFRCDVCGHEWAATGSHFFNTRRVGGCQKCSYAAVGDINRLDLDEIHEFAKKHGGVCLSESYGHIKQKYKFRCSRGHEFEDIYNNMKFRDRFCPTCEDRFMKRFMTDEEALEILKKYNLEPRSPRPKRLTQGWPAKCLVCDEDVSTSLQHLIDRGSPCRFCSGFAISEKQTRAVFAKAKLEPIEPFKSGTVPWRSKCLTCGAIVNGRYSNLVKGQSGCRKCYFEELRKKKASKSPHS